MASGEVLATFGAFNLGGGTISRTDNLNLTVRSLPAVSVKLRAYISNVRNANPDLRAVVINIHTMTDVAGARTTSTQESTIGGSLGQNYPNPFNPSTTISYFLPNAGHATIKLYDVLGREIATIVDRLHNPGQHNASIDGTSLSSGVYFYRLETAATIEVRRMLLMK